MKIKDKRVVVTGAASGIGLALCEEFHASGAQSIVCVDMNEDGAKEIAEKINGIAVIIEALFFINKMYKIINKAERIKNVFLKTLIIERECFIRL